MNNPFTHFIDTLEDYRKFIRYVNTEIDDVNAMVQSKMTKVYLIKMLEHKEHLLAIGIEKGFKL